MEEAKDDGDDRGESGDERRRTKGDVDGATRKAKGEGDDGDGDQEGVGVSDGDQEG